MVVGLKHFLFQTTSHLHLLHCLSALQCETSRKMAPPVKRFRAKRSLLPLDQRKFPESSGLMTVKKHELVVFLAQ